MERDFAAVDRLIVDRLRGLFGARLIYRFGSTAEGRARSVESDIDVAFLAEREIDPVKVFDVANALAAENGVEVDLVDLYGASTVMRKEVVVNGKCLYEDGPGSRAVFEMYALSDYARLNEERRPVLEALL
ncbi:MAG: nucleotidyltransferase domain-containing protein [Opitutales bacterium]|nr:nucleotidyltransferase domain-containing protein [Opitutales bacterium]